MKQNLIILFFALCFALNVFGQIQDKSFEDIYYMISQKNFFKAKDIYSENQNNLSPIHKTFIESFLYNAFGKLTQSNEKIAELIENNFDMFHDTLKIELCTIQEDNFVKLYEYKEAKKTIEFILNNFSDMLSEAGTTDDYQNNLKFWTTLENQPKQTVTINDNAKLKIKKDKLGLKNLPVSNGKDTLDFIFDTGANFSTVALSVAERFNMNIFPVAIEASGSTGATFPVQIAVCPEFYLGNIKIQNAVFLVLDDKQLSFKLLFIKYNILGIIGYPVIEALKEVQLTKDGYFIVPEKETVFAHSNMAMNKLTPLISIEGNPFNFDTGADHTSFKRPYYLANREEIEDKYKTKTVKIGGAGGNLKEKCYIIDAKLTVSGKEVNLKKVPVSKYTFREEGIWGWIGKDVIEQFDTTTINFNKMFIKFD